MPNTFVRIMSRSFRKSVLLASGILIASFVAHAQRTISGTVTDASSGEQILGASVVPVNNSRGTSTNLYGFYSLTLNDDANAVAVSFIGFQTKEIQLTPGQSVYNVGLEPAVIAFERPRWSANGRTTPPVPTWGGHPLR